MRRVALRWGFKSEANALAREVRHELKLRPADPLDLWALAHELDIPVETLSSWESSAPLAARHFAGVEPDAFSAVTVFRGRRRLIVHNDAHTKGRQASNLAHELSHALLQHPPTPALDDRGCREWDQDMEDEATWLGGAFLISEEATLLVARQSLSVAEVAQRYGVSEPMVRFRLNVTGAITRVARAGWDFQRRGR